MSEHENERPQPYPPPTGSGTEPPPYGQPPGNEQAYGQQYGQPPGSQYGQQSGAPPYGQPAYGSAPYPGEMAMYPEPSQAVLGLVLGIIGLVAFPLIAPFAWVVSNREIEGIDAGRRPPANRGMAVAGKVTGIIGTVLLALGVLILIVALLGFFAVARGS